MCGLVCRSRTSEREGKGYDAEKRQRTSSILRTGSLRELVFSLLFPIRAEFQMNSAEDRRRPGCLHVTQYHLYAWLNPDTLE